MNWVEHSLDDLGTVQRGRSRHRPRDSEHLYGGLYPFIQTANVKHANLYLTEYSQTYSEAGLAQSRLWPSGTLCITIAANIAYTAILGIDACFPDSIIGFIPFERKADVRFIKYLFDALLQRRYQQFSQGAAQDNLSQAKLLSLRFPVPTITEQRRIADILSTYDRLIENNERRIRVLEKATHLLYAEWFVRRRFPGHERIKLRDGIPEGWDKKALGEIVEIRKGKNITKKSAHEGNVPVVAGGIAPAYFHDTPNVRGPVLTVSASGANAGFVNLYHEDIWASDCSYIGVEQTEQIYFVYLLLKSRQQEIFGFQKGTAQPHVYPRDLATLKVLWPTSDITIAFEKVVGINFDLMRNLKTQNKALVKARDLLIPRLVNGGVKA